MRKREPDECAWCRRPVPWDEQVRTAAGEVWHVVCAVKLPAKVLHALSYRDRQRVLAVAWRQHAPRSPIGLTARRAAR